MFTGQAAETILGFFPPSLQSTKSTHTKPERTRNTVTKEH